MRDSVKRVAIAVAMVLAVPAVAVAYLEVQTPAGVSVGTAVQMWLNGANQAEAVRSTITPTNKSGTITLGGTAQTLAAANTSRHAFLLQNQSSGDLWVNDVGGTAAAIQPAIYLPAGSVWTCGGLAQPCSATALSLFGATTGQAFAAREQ